MNFQPNPIGIPATENTPASATSVAYPKAGRGETVPMKAISVRQPWAWAIIHAGKDIENRPRNWNFRGRILIHASSHRPTYLEMFAFVGLVYSKFGTGFLEEHNFHVSAMEFGGIIGSVEITDCVIKSDSPWFVGKHGLVLRDPKPLEFQRCKGQLGIFTPKI